jgi:hypothetical protein
MHDWQISQSEINVQEKEQYLKCGTGIKDRLCQRLLENAEVWKVCIGRFVEWPVELSLYFGGSWWGPQSCHEICTYTWTTSHEAHDLASTLGRGNEEFFYFFHSGHCDPNIKKWSEYDFLVHISFSFQQ